MAAWIWQRLCCCVIGHDYAIMSAEARMFLRCRNCGLTSPGLDLVERPFGRRAGEANAPGSRAAAGHSHPAAP